MVHGSYVWQHDQATVRLARERLQDGPNLSPGANGGADWHGVEGRCCGFDRSPEHVGEWSSPWTEHQRHSRYVRRDHLQHLQPFASDRELESSEASEIAARPP